MTDRLEQALRDMQFELPGRVMDRALASAAARDARPVGAWRDARRVEREPRSMSVAALVAVFLAAALLAALLYGVSAVHSHPVPVSPPRVETSDVTPPVAIAAPFKPDCAVIHNAYGCGMQEPFFANGSVGWLTAGYEGNSGQTNLYRTTDGGAHWSAVMSWDGPGAADIKTSTDGRQALIATGWGPYGPALLYTLDGGASWKDNGVPATALQCLSVAGNCEPKLQSVYFSDPREGWVFAQGPTQTAGRLFHTTDSGAHWTLTATIDLITAFPGINPASLDGKFAFASSTTGWFVPNTVYSEVAPRTLYATVDGGVTWRPETIKAGSDLRLAALHTFGARNVVVELRSGTGLYVATSADGGLTWSPAQTTPAGRCGFSPCAIEFIDGQHWVVSGTGSLYVTADAGVGWAVVGGDPPTCCLVQFTDLKHGWSLGGVVLPDGQGANALFKTTDGGAHWTMVALPVRYTDLYPA